MQGLYHYANGDLAWGSDNVKVVLCTLRLHAEHRCGRRRISKRDRGAATGRLSAAILPRKTNVGGTLDAANLVFSSVSGSTVTQFAMYNDTGTSSTSQLQFLWDTATNLPVVPNGGNITIQWAGSPNYIATLCAGLSERDKRLIDRLGLREIVRWIRELGIPADRRSAGGIWIPTPSLVQG